MTDTTKHYAVERLTEFVDRSPLSIIDQISMLATGEATVGTLVDDIQTVLAECARLNEIGEPKIEDWMMNNPDVRASSERMIKIGKRTDPIEGMPDLPELQHLVSDVKTMFLAFEAELEDFSKHNAACADENDTLREEVSMLESAAETQSAEIERLRAEVNEFHEYLSEDDNAQAFRGWQILKAKVKALKGGAA